VAVRILHVSDLHVGALEDAEVEMSLNAFTAELRPDLVVATGDLTHRGRQGQHERAAALLRGLGPPVVAVPGNHDIPYTFPGRFTRPWAEFERGWETAEPVHRSDGLCVVGLNSVRPWRQQSGGLRTAQLRWAAERFAEAPAGALRVAAMHHQMIGAPWRTRKRPVARRSRVLGALLDAGAELILSGHTHQGAVAERHEFEVWADDRPGVTVSTAPGLGQPRPRRRGEARGLVVYEADAAEIRAHTYVWRGDVWGLTAVRRFPRGTEPLTAVQPQGQA
jgi:3',5'-cyclic AMP phosphodiesterase CpdA